MLNIYLLAVEDKMPQWVERGFSDYQKRIKGRFNLHLVQVPAIKRGKNADISRIRKQEEEKLLGAGPAGAYLIALDRSGKSLSTLEMSQKFEHRMQLGQPISLLVGGPEGFTPQLLDRADEKWSLSALTFSHPVVRVLLAEQLYRVHSILENLPYHR